jgi:hypothetical protein
MTESKFGKVREYGKRIDFGKTAADHSRFRAGYPASIRVDLKALASARQASARLISLRVRAF